MIAVGVLMIVSHILTEDDASVVEQTLEKYKAKVARFNEAGLVTFALYFSRICSTTLASFSVSKCTTIIKHELLLLIFDHTLFLKISKMLHYWSDIF